ncbi:VOC family protein [Streptomyces sp. XM83C]|jgi:catechol 2,3-dioxygenase-like lactoylglutathione lyase family enzyme|uniref:VOC family protein n=1 Tax=Streptomyces thermocoprophilus TaxID=78356 RepID=A0ABV5VK66_9ACTN|nr:VOC family protein [Streptomyces sp. XM83C]MCK1821821.1 VOC family protein [Streptomyces sp. XM83C]
MTDNSTRLDHVVLWVRDPAASTAFYQDVLGLEPVRLTEHKNGEAPFPSVRVSDETIIDLMPVARAPRLTMVPGADGSTGHPVNHICLSVTETAFDALLERLRERAVPMSGVSHNSFGARGRAARNVYFRDPDGNVMEVRHYD